MYNKHKETIIFTCILVVSLCESRAWPSPQEAQSWLAPAAISASTLAPQANTPHA